MIIKSKQDEIQNYLKDASNYSGNCDAVYFPESESDIIEILIDTNKNKKQVTVSGNRTGLTGSGIPNGGIVISTEKLNNIKEINFNKKFVQLQPGVLLSDLQNKLKENNLFYPPDPTETSCFIGGTIASNASGASTFKYGPTRDYILELTIILAEGDKLKIKRGENFAKGSTLNLATENKKEIKIELPDINIPDIKNAAGYYCKKNMDAIDLFIGSEGTLGIISDIKLKVLELPKGKISCVVFFNVEVDGLQFIKKSREVSIKNKNSKIELLINALALEFFDEEALKFLKSEFPNIPINSKCAVWFEQETNGNDEETLLSEWIEIIKNSNGNEEQCWFALNEKEEQKIKDFRHCISEKINEYMASKGFRKLGTDVAVPDDKFLELYNYAKIITKKEKIKYANYGHFGNSHMHFNFMPENEKQYLKSKKLYDLICHKAISLDGTVSAEHGIGKTKKHLFLEMYGKEAVDKMFSIKKTLDPNLILGRGNLF